MCAPKLPEPPDPYETAQAQTGSNISTATANAALGNVNQVTPYGSLTYSQSGQTFVPDNNGQTWWKGPDGQLTQNAPTGYSAGTTTKEPIYREAGDGQQILTGYKDVTTGASGGIPDGWEQVSGYYVPNYTATQELSPGEQAVYESGLGARQNLADMAKDQSARIKDHLSTPFTLDGVPAAGDASKIYNPNYSSYSPGQKLATSFGDAGEITKTYNTDFSEDRQRVEDALWERQQSDLNLQLDRLQQQLANQGIRIGSDAYGSGMDDYGRTVNDARLATILAAGQEQSRLVGLERDRALFENAAQGQNYDQLYGRAAFGNAATQGNNDNAYRATAGNNQNETARLNAALAQFNAQNQSRTQAVNEQFALRNQPINEISALMSGSQVNNPNFVNTNMPTIPTTDIAGLIQQDFQNQSSNAMAQYQAGQGIMGGLFGLGSAAIMASDRRVKKDVKKVGRLGNQNLYEFRYKSDGKDTPKTVGFMAQEVERKNPDAVMQIGGIKHVNMSKALDGLFALGKAA
ncbi:MAG: tail fiber domain-containing protein [Rhizobiaceae bacterium]